MLSKNNQILARHAKADHQQRWALRKLTIGVASVLLGGTLLVVNGTPVAADQVNPENATAVKSEPEMSNTKQDAENAVTLASTASDRPAVNATSGEQSPAGVGAEAMLATPAASPAPSDPSVTAPPQSATLASGAPGQMQPAVTKQQAPEMGWRKMEDGDQLVTYYVIVREVTLVKPDGDEVVMPLQVWDTLAYVSEDENDELDPIQFAAIEVDPIAGAKAPVIPAISQSVHSFLNMDGDNIEISYVTSPVQRIGMVEVTALPEEPKYDDIFYQYEDQADKYENDFNNKEGIDFGWDGLLLKEKYKYIVDDEPTVVEGQEEKTITRTIHVHLPNGEVQTTTQPVTLERKYTSVAGSEEKQYEPWTVGRWESFTAPEQTGYTALPGSVAEVEVTSESLDAVVDIYYRADEPAVVEGQEEKTITRTIHVHLPNGEVQTTTQPVTLTRTYTKVNGQTKYSEWTTGTWESFTAPEQTGYTALPDSVAEVEVTSESLDAVVDIYYRADEAVIESGQEEKTITRTINVHLPNGEVQTTTQPVTLERKYTSVAGSEEKKYGPWTVGRWESLTAPEQAGYTALPGGVAEVEVTFESLDAVVDIYYRADDPAVVEGQEEKTITRTINVHLPNGEVQTAKQPVTLERKYTSVAGSEEKKYGPWTAGRWESFTVPEQAGYTALPGSVAEVEVTSESLDAVVDIYYRADEAVIESGQEEKTITRTINVHLPNGEVQTTTQPVTLVRQYTSVAGSDEKNYGPWNTGQWNAFTAPELAGYTAMPGSVASVEVTSEILDVVVDIYYRIDIPPKVEVGPDPEQPTTDPDPEQPTTDPDPEQPTTDPDPEQPTTDPDPEQPTTDPDPEQPTTDPDPEQPTTDPDLEQPIGHPVAPATVAPDQQANLPQTGNATSSLVALLGATLATFLGSLLLLGKRKR